MDLAIAMLETQVSPLCTTETMTTNHTSGDAKTGEATNFGICLGSEDHYDFNVEVARHRNGQNGLDDPITDGIATYESAIRWIQAQAR
ncbi:hypothetical protein P170DRAFT_479833 [Aspergillus steynii IBT 23096]|uniref:Uncharacterized protein n=1 Tax=Aspergillus steynii IBT 23096 TaxID=1392250 RepID=A0A2I2FXH6_9EURO|nr:uncharacterized protein P170DRAFT_479833 [Aspergillus steynii IBT 23096]PLB45317.1 hypothetical protein P170DRAFT_479833 [Aspergillus steynii IBT 23096]